MREIIVEQLKTKVNNASAIAYEKRIWNWCNKNNLEYSTYVYDILGELLNAKNKEERINIINGLKQGKYGWNSFIFETYKAKNDKLNSLLTPQIEEGEFKCRKKDCRSLRCFFETHQTRSRDEGMTGFVICSKCSSRYKVG